MEQPKFIDKPCPTCGGKGRQVNGAWLRERRLAARVSLRDVAATLGISAPYLSDIELNRRNPPQRVIAYYEERL